MGRGARLADYRRAEEQQHRVTAGALRVPDTQAEGILGRLTERRLSCLQVVDNEDTASFTRREYLARIKVLTEVAVLAGAGETQPPAETRKKRKAAAQVTPGKPESGMPQENYLAYQRKVLTPEGWRDTLGKALLDKAEECLASMLEGKDVDHGTMLRQECLNLYGFLCNVDTDGLAAEAKMNRGVMRMGGGYGGR